MEDEIDFGDLSNDDNFKQRILGFRTSLEKSSKMLKTFLSNFNYEELSLEDKVRYDLFMAFAINSYFWMYLRIQGVEPSQHDIRFQIDRVKEYMNKSKQIYEKKTLMPRINREVAKTFVRSGLWDLKSSKEIKSNNTETNNSRKRKNDEMDN